MCKLGCYRKGVSRAATLILVTTAGADKYQLRSKHMHVKKSTATFILRRVMGHFMLSESRNQAFPSVMLSRANRLMGG